MTRFRNARLLVFCVCVLSAASTFSQKSVTIAVGEWPPYLSERLPHFGFSAEIVSGAFAKEGFAAEYKFYPWIRAYATALACDADATLLWVKTNDREKDFFFSDVVVTGTAVFFHLKSRVLEWKSLDDLQGLKIGGLRSGSYHWFDKGNLELAAAFNRGLAKLKASGEYQKTIEGFQAGR